MKLFLTLIGIGSIWLSLALNLVGQDIHTSIEPRITMRVADGRYTVSGTVSDTTAKDLVISEVKKGLPQKELTFNIKTDITAKVLWDGWKDDLVEALKRAQSWNAGILMLSRDASRENQRFVKYLAETEVDTFSGEKARLNDPRKSTTLIYLFATWCGPCRSQIPILNRLYSEFSARGFEIIAIDSDGDESRQDIERFVKQTGMRFKIVPSSASTVERMISYTHFEGIPQAILLSNGSFRAVFRGEHPKENTALQDSIVEIYK